MGTSSMSAYPTVLRGVCRHTGRPYEATITRGHLDKIESLLDGFAAHVLPGLREVAPVRFEWRHNLRFEAALFRGVIHLRQLSRDEF